MSTLRANVLQNLDSTFSVRVEDLLKSNLAVNNVAALRAVDTTQYTWVYRAGYSASGDGGDSFWTYNASATGAESATVVVPNVGAGRWLLNHNGTLPVGVAGAVGNGIVDDFAAIQRAHDTKLTVVYKPTTYRCGSKVTATAPFGMIGGGIGRTYIDFTGATQGFEVLQNNAADGFDVQGVTFLTAATPASGYTALKLNGTGQVGNTPDGSGHLQIGDRTMFRGTVRDVEARGKTISQGFSVGLNFRSIMNFTAQNLLVRGQYQSAGNYAGVGVLVNGDGIPTDFSIDRIWTFYTSYSVFLPDYVEGGHITNFEFVHTMRGVYGAYDVNWSTIAPGICGALGMFVDNGHANTRLYGVYLENTNQNNIGNLNIYLNPLIGDSTAIGVHLKGGASSSVDSVKVNGDAALNTKANNFGVLLSGTSLATVQDCFFAGGGAVVRTVAGCSNNNIHHNRAISCVNVVSSDATDAGNLYSENFGTGLSGNVYAVSPNNRFNRASAAFTVVRALVGGAPNETVGLALPANVFLAKPTVVFMEPAGGSSNPSFTCSYDYDNVGNTASTAVMNVRLAGGGNLPGGNYRFSVRAEE